MMMKLNLLRFTYGMALSSILTLNSMAKDETLVADEFFKVETLATGFVDAMEMAPLPNGDVFITERTGALKLFVAETGKVELVKKFDVSVRKGLKETVGFMFITHQRNLKFTVSPVLRSKEERQVRKRSY